MEKIIKDQLDEIEKASGIHLLFACESGSRGWQFPSPDSDYDVRFIYVRKADYYLSIVNRNYDLKFPITGELDIHGWDIRKALQLIRKSNTTPFEWLQSPIIYKELPGFREDLWTLCQDYFSQRANIHHYLGIAQGALDTLENGNEIKIKKLFYVLRPLLAAKWCLERNCIAPMTFGPLMALLPGSMLPVIEELMALKARSPEGFIIHLNAELHAYINDEYARISAASSVLERNHFDELKLDQFFVKTIRKYDN